MRPSRIVAPVALGLALVIVAVRWAARPVDPALGRPFPHLALERLPGAALLSDTTLRAGHPTLVNLFASWCLPCRAEAPQLVALRGSGIAVAGIAVRDAPADAARFLAATGSPFAVAGLDPHEHVQSHLASAGIPESWLVDGHGIVRAHFRGNLSAADGPKIAAFR